MSLLFKVSALFALLGCAAWVTLHFSGVNVEAKLLGDRRTVGSDAFHLILGLAALHVAYVAFRRGAR